MSLNDRDWYREDYKRREQAILKQSRSNRPLTHHRQNRPVQPRARRYLPIIGFWIALLTALFVGINHFIGTHTF